VAAAAVFGELSVGEAVILAVVLRRPTRRSGRRW
jgi:hypothetical protein